MQLIGLNWGWVIALAALTWSVVSFLWMRSIGAESATKKEMGQLKAEIQDVKQDITRIETTMEGLPTRDMVHAIDRDISRLAATVAPMAATIGRIEDFFMQQKRTRGR